MNEAEEQKEVREYLRPILKRWWLILLVVPAVTIGTYLYYDHKPKVYESSASLYYEPSTLQELLFGRRPEATKLSDFALLVNTAAVHERASELLTDEAEPKPVPPKNGIAPGVKAPAVEPRPVPAPKVEVKIPKGTVSALAIEKSNFMTISATSSTPEGAAKLANASAAAFIGLQKDELIREARRGLRASRERIKELEGEKEVGARREGLEKQVEQLELVISQPNTAGLKVVAPALPNPVPLDHEPTDNAIFAFFVGLLLAIGACYGLEYLNRKITRVEDIEDIYKLPILTEVPRVSSPAPLQQQRVVMDKMMQGPFHRLRTNLEMQAKERPIRTIAIASAAPEEGKSIVARNLAIAYREAGHNVAVLDADLRKASISKLLSAREGLGLTDILAGRAAFGEVVQEVAVQIGANGNGNGNGNGHGGELAMIPAGVHGDGRTPPLGTEPMRQTLLTAADTYGTAIIDSPPLLALADAMPLLSEADAVVLVVRLGVTTHDSARRMVRELKRIPGVNVAGIVVNGIPSRTYRARSYGYYYG